MRRLACNPAAFRRHVLQYTPHAGVDLPANGVEEKFVLLRLASRFSFQ
jgi:hypothetical protein